MSGNRTPAYRSFKKDYGGDPDSTILRDLHRCLMKVEIALSRAQDHIRIEIEEGVADRARLLYLKQLIDLHHQDRPTGKSVVSTKTIDTH